MRDRILDFIGNHALNLSSEPTGMGSVCQRICQLPQTIANNSATAEETRRQSRGVRSIENARTTSYQPDINLTEISTDNTSTNVDISEGTAKHTSMITPLQKQQLEEQSYMNSKYLSQKGVGAKEKSGSDNTLGFKDSGAGELCEICNLHHKTHFAIPCGHSACLTCWSRWLYSKPVTNINNADEERRNENCFVCHRKVSKIKRYSFAIVPLKLYENRVLDFSTTELNGFADSISGEPNVQAAAIAERLANDETLEILQIAVEDSLERVVRSLLEVKDDLLENVVKRLEEAELHLFNLAQPSSLTALDAYASVLAVECVSVNELFRQYHKLFEDGSKWQALELEVEKLRSAVERVGKCLDSTNFVNELQGPNGAKTQNELSEVESILEICLAPTSIKVQWNQVKDLIYKSSGEYHLVPAILNVFENGGGVTASIFNAKQIKETLFYAEVKRDQMENLFTDLLLEDIPLMLSKLSLVTTAVKKSTSATSINS